MVYNFREMSVVVSLIKRLGSEIEDRLGSGRIENLDVLVRSLVILIDCSVVECSSSSSEVTGEELKSWLQSDLRDFKLPS